MTQRDINLFAAVTRDVNPVRLDPAFAEASFFGSIVAHGMWGAGLLSAVLGAKPPGPGAIHLGQDLRFRRPVAVGDTIAATVTVRGKTPAKGDVTLDCVCANQRGEVVITGTALTRVPIVLTSRADSARTRLASCALGVLMARAAGGAA